MSIENLEAFVYVVHFGSFNKAAEALFLTQPSITARIRSLENELNTSLFRREGRKVYLTESGKKLIPYAERILHAYQEATYKVKQHMVIPDQLRIGCSNSVSNYIIPEILPLFRKTFPHIRVKIISNHTEEILAKILNHEVDFGIVRATSHPKLDSKIILHNPIGLFAAPHHPLLKKNQPVSMEDIVDHDLIFYDHNSVDWLFINRLFEPMQLRPNVIVEVDSMETTKRLVKKGMGICFLPEHAVYEELNNQTLMRIPVETNLAIGIQISVMYAKEKEHSPFLQFFTNFTFTQFDRLPMS